MMKGGHAFNMVFRRVSWAVQVFLANDLSGRAQQIAYNVVVTLAPLLIFLTAFCGLVASLLNEPAVNPVQPVLEWLDEQLPAEAAEFLREPIEAALETDPEFLLSFGGLLTLWAAKTAVSAMIKGLNASYNVRETRGFLRTNGIAIGLTLGLAGTIIVASVAQLLTTDIGKRLADRLVLSEIWETAAHWLDGPIGLGVAAIAVLILHRVAPNVRIPLRWYLPGTLVTLVGLAVATWGLQFYFTHFGTYTDIYGIFGGVLVFLIWLYVLGLVVLIGGLVNAALLADVSSGSAAAPVGTVGAIAPEDAGEPLTAGT
jgi:membrane protein